MPARSLALLLLAVACAGPLEEDSEPAGPPTAQVPADAKADSGELRVRAGEMTLWVDLSAPVSRDGDTPAVTIRGRTSRTLTFAQAWVPDDAFGETTLVGPRSFEVRLRGGHEINSILSGLPLFVALEVASGPHARYDARIDLAPRFRDFQGYPEIWVDSAVDPVQVGGADSLRYRGAVNLGLEDVTMIDAGSPSLAPLGVTRTAVDFSWADLEEIFLRDQPVIFQNDEGDQKSARLAAATRSIGLTIEDPRLVWPNTCEAQVESCVADAVFGPELAACGSYRDVSHCAVEGLCQLMGSAPLSLGAIQLQWGYMRGLDAFVDGCATGYTWCSFRGIDTWMAPECLETPAELAAIVEAIGALDQDLGTGRFPDGAVLGRDALASLPVFSTTYSDGGPELLAEIDGLMDSGEVEAWWLSEEVPCHNCTDFQDTLILWYPAALRVVYLRTGHGYDS
jgi:hypothetical protein